MSAPSSIPDAAAILARLAPRSGILLNALQSGRFDEFRVLLASAAASFDAQAEYSEREVNERLKRWLEGPGVMLSTDHVELRRQLVDARLLARDGFGRRYQRVPQPPLPFAQALHAVSGLDAARIVAGARAEDAAKRAQRRDAHAGKAANG